MVSGPAEMERVRSQALAWGLFKDSGLFATGSLLCLVWRKAGCKLIPQRLAE